MSADILQRIQRLKGQVAQENLLKAKLEGKKESLLATLRSEYGVGSIEEAEELLKKLREQRESLVQRLESRLQKLEDILEEKGPI